MRSCRLQFLYPAAVLEHVEQHLDFSACPVSVDQLTDRSCCGGGTVGQQVPFDRLNASWRVTLAGHDEEYAHCLVLARRQFNAVCSQLLAQHTCLGAGARRQREFDLAERVSFREVRLQFFALGQAVIVRGAYWPVHRTGKLLRPCHRLHHVRFVARGSSLGKRTSSTSPIGQANCLFSDAAGL